MEQVSYGPLIMSIMLILNCYIGFFNVRISQHGNSDLRFIRRTNLRDLTLREFTGPDFMRIYATWLYAIYFCVKFQKDPLFGVNLTCFAPWLPWQRPPFWIFATPKVATHYGGYSYKISWSLMKGIQFFLNLPFLFPWQLW